MIKLLKVVITSIENIISTCFIRNYVHCLRVMYSSLCNMEECRHLCLYIIERMDFYAAFMCAECCPPKDTQAEVYGCRIKSIDIAAKSEYIRCPFSACLLHQIVSIVLKNVVIPLRVGICQIGFGDIFSETEVVTFTFVSRHHAD